MKNRQEREKGRNHGSSASRSNSLSTSRLRKPWSFFKLMLTPEVQSKRLRIPEVFAWAFRDELSGTVILTVPSGESWEVALIYEDDQLWFCNGWQEFVEYFSISFAYFLLFSYEGALKFNVHIFTPTACEIFYPCYGHNRRQRQPSHSDESEEQDSDDDVNIVNFGASSTRNDSDVELITSDNENEPSLHHHEEPISNSDDDVSDRYVGSLSASDDVELDPDKWSLYSSEINNENQGTPYVGDLWPEAVGLMEALASVGISKPKSPFFVVLIKKYHITGCFVRIPQHFTQGPFKAENGQIVKLEGSNRKLWSVRCVNTRDSFTLGSGWIAFARENSVKVGDVCVFELTDAENCVLKVHVGMKSQLTDQDRWREMLKNTYRSNHKD